MSSPTAPSRPGRRGGEDLPAVLVICTANECRSPSAGALLRAGLGPHVRVVSAGTRARPGRSLCPGAARWLGEAAGIEPVPEHESLTLEAGAVRDAALVLGAAREHRSAAVALVPSVQRRAFTLTQAARLATRLFVEGVSAPAGLAPADRLVWCVEELDAWRGDVPRTDPRDDDLPDPHDGRARHDEVLPRLAEAAAALTALLAGEPVLASRR